MQVRSRHAKVMTAATVPLADQKRRHSDQHPDGTTLSQVAGSESEKRAKSKSSKRTAMGYESTPAFSAPCGVSGPRRKSGTDQVHITTAIADDVASAGSSFGTTMQRPIPIHSA